MSLRRSAIALGVLGFCAGIAAPVAAEDSGTLAFVIRDWYIAMHESKFMDECPEGLTMGNDEIWWRSTSKEERAKVTGNGLNKSSIRYYEVMDRGKNGEDVCLNPTAVVDPPLRVVEGKIGYGENLDGTADGRATAKTCKHDKFQSEDGTKTGIDNQLARLVGCSFGWRKSGMIQLNGNEVRGSSGYGMVLMELTGVNTRDPRNSDNVTVTFYRSIDQFALDNTGRPLPFSTYRIETVNGKPRYADSLKAKIKDGVLQTERGDVRLPFYDNHNWGHPTIRDMGVRLEISADGSVGTGMVTGYYNVEEFWYLTAGVGQVLQTGQFSCPAMYVAAHKLADGYPDPKSGECTSLSAGFNIKAYAAFVLHPEKERRQASR